MFSAGFGKQDENDQVLDEIKSKKKKKFHQNSKQSDINFIDIRSQLEGQIQNREREISG